MNKIAPYYKAATAVVVPFLGAVGAALTAQSDGGSNITATEWLGAIVLALVSGGAVFAVPNKDYDGTHQDQSTQPPAL